MSSPQHGPQSALRPQVGPNWAGCPPQVDPASLPRINPTPRSDATPARSQIEATCAARALWRLCRHRPSQHLPDNAAVAERAAKPGWYTWTPNSMHRSPVKHCTPAACRRAGHIGGATRPQATKFGQAKRLGIRSVSFSILVRRSHCGVKHSWLGLGFDGRGVAGSCITRAFGPSVGCVPRVQPSGRQRPATHRIGTTPFRRWLMTPKKGARKSRNHLRTLWQQRQDISIVWGVTRKASELQAASDKAPAPTTQLRRWAKTCTLMRGGRGRRPAWDTLETPSYNIDR